MKIERKGNFIFLKEGSGDVLNIIPLNSYIAKNSIKDDEIVISSKSTNQSLEDSIRVVFDNVTHIDGIPFSGDRVDLLNKLAVLFSGCACGSGIDDVVIELVTIQQLNATNFSLTVYVIGDYQNNVASVDVNITDLIGNAAIPESISMSSYTQVGGTKIYQYNTLTFEDPSGAVGQAYGVATVALDSTPTILDWTDEEIVILAV